MSVETSPVGVAVERRRDPAAVRRRNLGIALFVIGAIILLAFYRGAPEHAQTTFSLTTAPAIAVPALHIPVKKTMLGLGLLCLVLGAVQLAWRGNPRTYLLLGIGLAAFGFAFLTWAGQGQVVDLVGLLSTSLIAAVPLTLGGLSGVLSERSGVINIAIEGQFLMGAFFAAVIASATHDLWLGLAGGALSGAVIGLILAVFTITYGADQIIVGVVLDAFALGLTSFFAQGVLVPNQQTLNTPGTFSPVAIPLLDRIPIIGPVVFDQDVFVYLTIVALVAIQVGLFHTRWGLRVRAVGEHPRAADTVGISVLATRYRNVVLGGLVAGIGGAAFSISITNGFNNDMTAGLGYIALACMIFGRWRPFGVLGAALLFGFADSLQFTLSVLNVNIPSSFLTMFPYIAVILAVSGLVGMVRPPAADGKPYSRE